MFVRTLSFVLLLLASALSVVSAVPITCTELFYDGQPTNCTVVEGTTTIEWTGLQNLTGLPILSTVNLIIQNNAELTSLSGLALFNLTGSLSILFNPKLRDIQSLSSVAGSLTGSLTIEECAMQDLSGLGNISSVRDLVIMNNRNLTSFSGFNMLQSIGGELKIENNPQLETLSALSTMNTDISILTISRNSILDTLDGLGGIRHIRDSLVINENPNLQTIAQLSHVTGALSSDLRIMLNPQLVSLVGLEGISAAGFVQISRCPSLTNLTGLQGLRNASKLYLQYNVHLENIVDLSGLSGAVEDLIIFGSVYLQSLSGLEGITSARLSAEISNNSAIVSMDGLQGLKTTEQLTIVQNKNLTCLNGLEALTSVRRLRIQGNLALQNISALSNLSGNITDLQIGGPCQKLPEEENKILEGFCELCHLDFFHSVEVYISIYNYLNASSPFSSVAEWEHAGKPCAPSLNCSSQALFPSATPSLSATVVPTPSVAPSPSHCPVNCSINLTAIADDIAAAGDDPEKLLVIAKKLLQATNQLDLSDNATRTLMNRLGGAIGRSFTNAMAATVADAMSSATILMQVAGSVLDGPVVSGFISGLGSGAGLMTGENDPEILAAVVGNGTALLAKISRQATDSQQGAQLVDAAELLALAHAKSGVSELVITNELAIGGQQGTIDVLAGVVFELLTSSITLPDDSQLTDLPGTFTLAPILWSNQSFPGNSLQNITAAVVLTVSLLSSDGTRQRVDNLDPPIRLAVPLSPGVRPQDVLCASFDHSRALWVPDGCELDLDASNATVAFCLCTHLTDFSVLVTTDGSPSESKGDGEAFPIGAIVGISVGGAAVLCACVLVSCFLIGAVLVLYRRRSKVFVITGTPTAFHNPESSF